MRKRGVMSGAVNVRALLVVLSLGTFSCGSPQGETDRPWQGTPVKDPDFEEMLRPVEPLESAGLFVGKDGSVHYVAHLRKEPGRDFLDAYRKTISSRGFLIFASGDSPHSIVPRITGYRFVVFKKGPLRPFTLFHRWFYDSAGKDLPFPRSYPSPVRLHGRTLVVTLGPKALEPWETSIVVPEADVVDVKELPFPRFPDAVLTSVDRHEGEYGLRETGTSRRYVARGKAFEEILHHYRRALEGRGMSIVPVKNTTSTTWRSAKVRADLTEVSLGRTRVMVIRTELTTETLMEQAPGLLEGFPTDVVAFVLHVRFATDETAANYWTAEDQTRRAALLAQEEKDK